MSKEILDSLDFFSNLTQKTLSAFHFTSDKDDLYDEVKILENLLTNCEKRKLVKVVIDGHGKYKRYFQDGFTDIVDKLNLESASYIELSPELTKIKNILDKDGSPLLSLRLGKGITLVENKEIDNPIEKIFFI